MSRRGTVLVYGATGTQGGPVAEQLLAAGRDVRVVTRDPERAAGLAARGAEVAVADLSDPFSLAVANKGVDQVVLHLPLQYDFDLHEAYGRNAIAAAREADVSMLVFNTSAHVLENTDVTIYQVRQRTVDLVLNSGVPAVVLRPAFYLDNLLGPWIKPGIVGDGVLAFPLPRDFPMSWIGSFEVAAYAVAALDRPHLAGTTFDIGGPAVTGDEMAARLADTLGRPVSYLAIDPDDYERALVPLFGPAVAFEVAAQVRCMIARGDGSLDMAWAPETLGVTSVDFTEWAARQDWTA